ncbi:MAG: DUF3291 domain-containing protein [Flavobacteriaceae bacterium]|nr:MAG: DUF3291 domain-containing protein [Flavobacteriaceae bacterium]
MKTEYQLAQFNVARMIGVTIEDPIMKEFVGNSDQVNLLAEGSEGFVWRFEDESNNSIDFNPFNDDQVITNLSVWKDIETLESFTYKTFHTEFIKRRKEWFQKYGKAHYVLWWIKKNQFPTLTEAIEKLEHLQNHGPTAEAFTFRTKFPKP